MMAMRHPTTAHRSTVMSDQVPQGPSPSPSSPPPVEPAPTPKSSSDLKTWVVAGVVAAIVAIAVVVGLGATGKKSSATATATGRQPAGNPTGSDSATGRRPFGNGVSGVVTKIDGTTLTVTSDVPDFARGGGGASGGGSGSQYGSPPTGSRGATTTYTVQTGTSTKFTKSETGSLSDLSKGQTVMVVGPNTDGTIAATQITQTEAGAFGGSAGRGNVPNGGGTSPGNGSGSAGPSGAANGSGNGFRRRPGFGGQGGELVLGTITAVKGTTITVRLASGGTATVTTSFDTKVTVTNQVTLAAIAKGDRIRATGTVSGTTIKATAVRIGDLGGPGGFAGRRGAFDGGAPPMGAAPGDGSSAPTTSSRTS
jgi:hypothetical protein